MSVHERAVPLDAKEHETAGKPVWIQIARVGQWAGHPSGAFQLGGQQFAEIVSAFKTTRNQRVPIDFEHASELDPRSGSIPTLGAPAQGWIVDLDNRGDGGLWALVEWLEPARSYIKEGKYKYFSPTIRFNARDPETGLRTGCRLSSGALTNQPFLDGMAPLAAKDTAPNASEKDDTGMDKDQEIINLRTQVATLTSEKTTLASDKTTLTNSEATLKLSLRDAESKLEAANKELETLRKFKSDTEAKTLSDRVDLAFATYKDEKKLTDDDKAAMTIVLKNDPATFDKLYPKAEPGTPHLLRNLTGGDGSGSGNGSETRRQSANEKDKPESIVTLADKIEKDQKVDRETAFVMAEKQLRNG